MNLTGVWLQNITGLGATIAFIDDGIDFNHPDLKDNCVSLQFTLHYNAVC